MSFSSCSSGMHDDGNATCMETMAQLQHQARSPNLSKRFDTTHRTGLREEMARTLMKGDNNERFQKKGIKIGFKI